MSRRCSYSKRARASRRRHRSALKSTCGEKRSNVETTMPSDHEPLLRTLAPALRELERRLRAWLNTKHRYPLTTLQRATLEGLACDLDRQAAALELDRPLLTIML